MTRPPHRVARRLAPALVALVVVLPGALAGQAGPYVVRDLAPGVFAAMAPPDVPPYLFANSLVVVGEDGVLVVDSGQRPELARALVAQIRERTDRPVRWLVNTHWHGDHVWGNAVFRDAFPGVRILATPATRDSVTGSSVRQVQEQLEQEWAGRVRLESMMDTADAALRARIRAVDSTRAARIAELEGLRIVEPTEMFTERTELDLGGRTAVLLPLGPAHTPGDAAVWLPGDGILAVGDLLEAGELWLEGADVPGWTRALDALADLDARIIVPSHGGVSADGALLAAGRAQLRDRALLRDSTASLLSVAEPAGPEAARRAGSISGRSGPGRSSPQIRPTSCPGAARHLLRGQGADTRTTCPGEEALDLTLDLRPPRRDLVGGAAYSSGGRSPVTRGPGHETPRFFSCCIMAR